MENPHDFFEELKKKKPSPIAIAKALHAEMKKRGLTQELLATHIGKKRSTVANYLRLLKLPIEIQHSIHEGEITLGHAKILISLPLDEQKKLWQQIKLKNLTVRQTEKQGEKTHAGKEGLFYQDVEKRIERKLGTKVKIIPHKDSGGEVSIRFYDHDDLERLLSLWEVHAAL